MKTKPRSSDRTDLKTILGMLQHVQLRVNVDHCVSYNFSAVLETPATVRVNNTECLHIRISGNPLIRLISDKMRFDMEFPNNVHIKGFIENINKNDDNASLALRVLEWPSTLLPYVDQANPATETSDSNRRK
jgi:hypothetical protein